MSQSTHSARSHGDSTVNQDPEVAPAWGEKTLVLEQALQEFWALQADGQPVDPAEFADRYPTYSKSLLALLQADASQRQLSQEVSWPQIGETVCGCKLARELGRGQLARVYLAYETALGHRRVVVKLSAAGAAEAHILGQLSHPNIVPIYSAQVDPVSGLTAVRMPYLGSTTLAEVLDVVYGEEMPRRKGREILEAIEARECLPSYYSEQNDQWPPHPQLARGSYVDAVVQLGTEMCEALVYTANRGIVHRDLKASNVLVTPNGQAMLLDFNLSRSDNPNEGETGLIGGTLPYMAPEQIREAFLNEGTSDAQSDLFSLGVILYEMLTGKLPYGDGNGADTPEAAARTVLNRQQRGPTPIVELNPEVDELLAKTVHECINPDRDERTANASDLLTQLQDFARRRQRPLATTKPVKLSLFAVACLLALGAITAISLRPTGLQRVYLNGLRHLGQEQLEEAIEELTSVIENSPDALAARTARGIAYMKQSQHELARGDFELVIKQQQTPLVYECLAQVQRKLRKREDAARSLESAAALASDPTRRSILFLKAASTRSLQESGPEAIWNCVQAAIEADPSSLDAHWYRANLYVKSDYDNFTSEAQALTDIEISLRGDHPSAGMYFGAAFVYARVNKTSPQDYTPRIEQLIQLAIQNGIRHKAVKHPLLKHYTQKPWVSEMLTKFPERKEPPWVWLAEVDLDWAIKQLSRTSFGQVP